MTERDQSIPRGINHVLAIDPGLDGVGCAVFDVEGYAPSAAVLPSVAAVQAWRASWTISTEPEHELADRCAAIALQLEADLQRWRPRLVYLEVPQIAGDYGDNRGRRRSVNLLHVGIGAVLAGVGAAAADRLIDVHQVKAGEEPKDVRQAYLETAFQKARIRLPAGPRGGTSTKEDERDAIYLGWWCLQNRVGRDLRGVA